MNLDHGPICITMSRPSHLPPRCPFEKEPIASPFQESQFQHHKYPSQGSLPGEHPSWLDDLLNDQHASFKRDVLRRAISDSATLLDGVMNSDLSLSSSNDGENSAGFEACGKVELTSVYGPNSPRRRGNMTFSENAIASALSEYVCQNPLPHGDGSLRISGNAYTDLLDPFSAFGEINAETKTLKRHSGQRSRVRKLQYIAELERTVDALQSVESKLAVQVASLLQERVALSIENSKLKQQFARLRLQKLMMDGEYKSLKKEVASLRNGLESISSSNVRSHLRSSIPAESSNSYLTWQMLDMAKLDIN